MPSCEVEIELHNPARLSSYEKFPRVGPAERRHARPLHPETSFPPSTHACVLHLRAPRLRPCSRRRVLASTRHPGRAPPPRSPRRHRPGPRTATQGLAPPPPLVASRHRPWPLPMVPRRRPWTRAAAAHGLAPPPSVDQPPPRVAANLAQPWMATSAQGRRRRPAHITGGGWRDLIAF